MLPQVAWVVRHRTDTKSGKCSRETGYIITDLTSRQEVPERTAKILGAHRWERYSIKRRYRMRA